MLIFVSEENWEILDFGDSSEAPLISSLWFLIVLPPPGGGH